MQFNRQLWAITEIINTCLTLSSSFFSFTFYIGEQETGNTFYLQLYGVRHMVNDLSDSERKPTAATWATLSD